MSSGSCITFSNSGFCLFHELTFVHDEPEFALEYFIGRLLIPPMTSNDMFSTPA